MIRIIDLNGMDYQHLTSKFAGLSYDGNTIGEGASSLNKAATNLYSESFTTRTLPSTVPIPGISTGLRVERKLMLPVDGKF